MKDICEPAIDTRSTDPIIVRTATVADLRYATEISNETAASVKSTTFEMAIFNPTFKNNITYPCIYK